MLDLALEQQTTSLFQRNRHYLHRFAIIQLLDGSKLHPTGHPMVDVVVHKYRVGGDLTQVSPHPAGKARLFA